MSNVVHINSKYKFGYLYANNCQYPLINYLTPAAPPPPAPTSAPPPTPEALMAHMAAANGAAGPYPHMSMPFPVYGLIPGM